MSANLLILGAGADRTSGIDFPMANTLLPEVAQYLAGDGQAVDEALRKALPGIRFSFGRLIGGAIDNLTTREVGELKSVIQRVQQVANEIDDENDIIKKQGLLIVRLFDKLVSIACENQIDEETCQLIKDVFGKDADEMVDNDSIVDLHKLSLSDTFKSILKRTLHQSLSGKSNVVAEALGMDMLNIEQLLIEKFLGFYNNKSSEIKNYIYIAWCLWAFLVHRQRQVLANYPDGQIPFYKGIPQGTNAITLNYTSFLENKLGRAHTVYFHGGLSEYVRMDTRDLVDIENILDCNPANFIETDIAPNIDVTEEVCENQKHVIPALVPPLRLKPILSHKYIELWHKASQWVHSAAKIIIVGYSFNNADEHFNDIIRVNKDKKFDIVGPHVHGKTFLNRIEKVLGIPTNNLVSCHVQGKPCKKAGNIRLIEAKADEVNLEELFAS
jgi:hypothetical protein